MTNVSARRIGAEVLGTLILTLFGGAAVILTTGNGAQAVVGPLAFGLALMVGINAVGPISGGHFNPTVTLALAVRGRFAWAEVPVYWLSQLVGGVLAGALLFFTLGKHPGLVEGNLAMTTVPSGVNVWAAVLAEALGTFLLCYTVLSLTDPDREPGISVALGIGLSLTVAAFAFGGVAGGSFNFARTFGPDLVAQLAGAKHVWSHVWVYLLGPAIGAVVAAYLNSALAAGRVAVAAPPVPKVVSKNTPKQKVR